MHRQGFLIEHLNRESAMATDMDTAPQADGEWIQPRCEALEKQPHRWGLLARSIVPPRMGLSAAPAMLPPPCAPFKKPDTHTQGGGGGCKRLKINLCTVAQICVFETFSTRTKPHLYFYCFFFFCKLAVGLLLHLTLSRF